MFSQSEWLRYTRHIQLPGFGVVGQTQLKNSHVLIVGMGGLGCPVSLYLAAAGVGKMTLVDDDEIDLTNLQRQVLFPSTDVGEKKVASAKRQLLALNPEIAIDTVDRHFDADLATDFGGQFDLVLDCTDNFATRYLINDYCLKYNLPWVYASIHQFSGQAALFTPETSCFRCLFPEVASDAPDCNSAGVIGVLPGLLGLVQANEAIRFLAGLSTPLKNTLALFNAEDLSIRKINLAKNTGCICDKNIEEKQSITLENDDSVMQCSVDSTVNVEHSLTPSEFNSGRDGADVVVLDVRSEEERKGFHIGGTHIPLVDLGENQKKLFSGKKIFCYCQSGKRSEQAAILLGSYGLNAFSLNGGIVAWLKSL